jgi:preprotein translocase subunit SecG
MIAKFNTNGLGAPATAPASVGDGKSMTNTFVVLGLIFIASYIAYQYFIKPKQEENSLPESNLGNS